MKVFFAHESIIKEEKVECHSPIVAWDVAHVKCQNCWISHNLHALGFIEIILLMWSLQEEGAQEASPMLKDKTCVRAITIRGLDNVVDVRNAMSEHLNVVVSTNTIRRALHEIGLESLEKQKKPTLTAKKICCKLEFAQCHQDWSFHD